MYKDNTYSSRKDCFQTGHKLQNTKKFSNRIQIMSKMRKSNEYEAASMQTRESQQITIDVVPLRKTFTSTSNTSDNPQLVKLFKQQLQIAAHNYQQRFKKQLKQTSIEISRLNMKLQTNNELLIKKDQHIVQLQHQITAINTNNNTINKNLFNTSTFPPTSPRSKNIPNEQFLNKKIHDLETKLKILLQFSDQNSEKVKKLFIKIYEVEGKIIKDFGIRLVILENKLKQLISKLQSKYTNKLNQEIELRQKLVKQQRNFSGQLEFNIEAIKGQISQIKQQLKQSCHKNMENMNLTIKELNFKIQFGFYKLSDLWKYFANKTIKEENQMQSSFDQNIQQEHSKSKQFSQFSNRKSISKLEHHKQSLSFYFDDYQEEMFEQLDSLYEDKFFYPLDSSFHRSSTHLKLKNQCSFQCTPTKNAQKIRCFNFLKSPNSESSKNSAIAQQKQNNSKKVKTEKKKTNNEQSSENFTSEDQSEESAKFQNIQNLKANSVKSSTISENQIRFIATIKQFYPLYEFPIPLDIDMNGMIKIRGEIRYLTDSNQKYFLFSSEQLNRLKKHNYITEN